jgi:hypothetical protein
MRQLQCIAWFLQSASTREEDLARCQILPPGWRRSPKKKAKGIKNQREESAFSLSASSARSCAAKVCHSLGIKNPRIDHESHLPLRLCALARDNLYTPAPLPASWSESLLAFFERPFL